jgi:hypothetical protein
MKCIFNGNMHLSAKHGHIIMNHSMAMSMNMVIWLKCHEYSYMLVNPVKDV